MSRFNRMCNGEGIDRYLEKTVRLRLKMTAWLLQEERQRSERFGRLLSLTEKLSATVHVRSI